MSIRQREISTISTSTEQTIYVDMALATSAGSSLLSQTRPNNLHSPPNPNHPVSSLTTTTELQTRRSRGCTNNFYIPSCEFPSSIASTSSGCRYLNMEPPSPTAECSDDQAPGGHVPLGEGEEDAMASCQGLLQGTPTGYEGIACLESAWQPDDATIFCTERLCPVNFGPPRKFYELPLRPLRHHCRSCGFIYCDYHSQQRIPLLQANDPLNPTAIRIITSVRVCDDCFTPDIWTRPISPSKAFDASFASISGMTGSTRYLGTPGTSDAGDFGRVTPPYARHSPVEEEEVVIPQYPPLEPWMGPTGELSLYPLAANGSHIDRVKVANFKPAIPPLYAPNPYRLRPASGQGGQGVNWPFDQWGFQRDDYRPVEGSDGGPGGYRGGMVRNQGVNYRIPGTLVGEEEQEREMARNRESDVGQSRRGESSRRGSGTSSSFFSRTSAIF